jgi:hypothetical protein
MRADSFLNLADKQGYDDWCKVVPMISDRTRQARRRN